MKIIVVFRGFAKYSLKWTINPLNAELNPICHLLALLRAHHILHVSSIRVNYLFIAHLGRRKSNLRKGIAMHMNETLAMKVVLLCFH